MNQKSHLIFFLIIVVLTLSLVSCNSNLEGYNISITNHSDLKRDYETIEIHFNQLPDLTFGKTDQISVTDNSGKKILAQFVDLDSDSIVDYLIFQSDFNANETKQFTVLVNSGQATVKEDSIKTFCRFVPERMDDFAWENDRVAFRTYGPECQNMAEQGNLAGLISSGIDCWLKRVNYPIIDKWYAKNSLGKSYHVDEGEGLDNYHVGTSRGCGGTAIPCDDKYITSGNFQKWRIIANGPIRSIFELEYPPYEVCGKIINEKKRFSIDLGSNFYHCDVVYGCDQYIDIASVGITLHDDKGKTNSNPEKGWFAYWEPLDDSFLGTAILIDPNDLTDFKLVQDGKKDASHLWVNVKLRNNSFGYWAGFGWQKSEQFANSIDWENKLTETTLKNSNPVTVKISK